MPTGGVIVPIPFKMVMITPNQIGSYPKDFTHARCSPAVCREYPYSMACQKIRVKKMIQMVETKIFVTFFGVFGSFSMIRSIVR